MSCLNCILSVKLCNKLTSSNTFFPRTYPKFGLFTFLNARIAYVGKGYYIFWNKDQLPWTSKNVRVHGDKGLKYCELGWEDLIYRGHCSAWVTSQWLSPQDSSLKGRVPRFPGDMAALSWLLSDSNRGYSGITQSKPSCFINWESEIYRNKWILISPNKSNKLPGKVPDVPCGYCSINHSQRPSQNPPL